MKVRVAILGTTGKSLLLDTTATNGAVIGENLFLDDGTVPTLEQLRTLLGGEDAPAVANTVWKLIQEIPANVTEVEQLATSGLVVRQVSGDWITRSIAVEGDGLLQLTNPLGEAGNPTLGAASIAALSVWGRAANTSGKPAPIVAASDTTLLRRSGTSVGFGTITSAYISDFAERAQDEVFGAIADSARIDFAYDDALNAFTADLIAGSVANSFLADMAQARIKGRADAAGTGAPTDLTGAQVATIIGYTAADVLTKLLTVDGAGSGIDADLLDGLSSAAFSTAVHSHSIAEVTGLTAALAAKLDSSSYTAADVLAKLITVDGAGSGLDADLLDGNSSAAFVLASAYTAADVLTKLLTVDGSGSGLDADLLDGISSAAFAQLSGATFTGTVGVTSTAPRLLLNESDGGSNAKLFDILADGSALYLRTRTDVDGTGFGLMYVPRTASTTPDRVLFGDDTVFPTGMSTTANNAQNYPWLFTRGNNSTTDVRVAVACTGIGGWHAVRYNTSLTSPTQIANGDVLGENSFSAYNSDNTSLSRTVRIRAQASQAWTGATSATQLDILATSTGSHSPAVGLTVTGVQLLVPDGSASLPAYSYINDTNTGFFRVGTDQLGVAAGGVQIGNYSLTGITRILTVGDGTNNLQLICDAAAANTRDLIFRTAASNRWLFRANATAEGGSNAGTDFEILRRTDAGASLGTAVRIVRSSGQWLFEDGAVATPELTFASDTDTGIYRIGANNLGIACNAAKVLDIATTGLTVTGNLTLGTLGNGVAIKEGTNAAMGVATLVAGTVVVANTRVTANSRIQLTGQTLGTVAVPSAMTISARVAGTSFTILASALTDTSVVAWEIKEPAP